MRRIAYVSGTRADFGLLANTLCAAAADPRLQIEICVTGMHLLPQYGATVNEIEASGLPIMARVPVELDGGGGASMARALGHTLIGLTDVLATALPDAVLLLGDRGEMLAGALAALHMNIPIFHLHGGERSGTIDESVRHAISKIAHYHLVSTAGARERLIRMGELPERIFITGAPGLDGLLQVTASSRDQLCIAHNFDSARPVALLLFHPVVQEATAAGQQAAALLSAVAAEGLQALCLVPNADAGGAAIRTVLQDYACDRDIRVITHLQRDVFVSWMAAADIMLGNSSSGIIEAASLGLPVVNIGSRQAGRERSGNTVDCPPEVNAIRSAIGKAMALRGRKFHNVYGDGAASQRIVDLLATLSLDPHILDKMNAY